MAGNSAEQDDAERFLKALALSGNITRAARDAGVKRHAMLSLQKASPEFAARMRDARDEAVDLLEAEARRRALDGVEEPIIRGGDFLRQDDGSIAVIRRYSDRLLELLLKAHRPEIFARGHGQNTEGDPALSLAPEDRADRVARLLDAARMRRARSAAGG
jgi:hypothetical protein